MQSVQFTSSRRLKTHSHSRLTLAGSLQSHRFSFVIKIRQCLLLATSAVRLSCQLKGDVISSTTVVRERPVPADFLALWASRALLGWWAYGLPLSSTLWVLPSHWLPSPSNSTSSVSLSVPGILSEALISLHAYRTWQVLCSLGGPPADSALINILPT